MGPGQDATAGTEGQSPVEFARAEIAPGTWKSRSIWFNLEILHLLAEQLPPENPRRAKIIYMLNKSVDAFDYTHTDEAIAREVRAGGERDPQAAAGLQGRATAR